MPNIHQLFATVAAVFRSKSGKARRLAPAPNRARLGLESLDLRLPPSSVLDPELTDPLAGTTNPTVVSTTNTTSTDPTTGSTTNTDTTTVNTDPSGTGTGTTVGTDPTATDPGTASTDPNAGPINFAPVENNDAADGPQLINLKGAQVVGGTYVISGDVVAPSPGGWTVTLGGEPDTLRGMQLTTDASGHFEKVVDLKTDKSDNGTLSAQGADAAGATTNLALTIIRPG